MKRYGLIGYPLTHSFSGNYFTDKFLQEKISDCRYDLFPIKDINNLQELISKHPDLLGLNVTIPFKTAVIPLLNELDLTAKETEAVNTICIDRNQGKLSLKGHNTDVVGFIHSLLPLLKKHHAPALILGTGGGSKAVAYALTKMGIPFRVVSRQPEQQEKIRCIGYTEITKEILENHHLIINTTPLGMFPETNACPDIPYKYLTSDHLLYDLIYNPEETMFLRNGKLQETQIKNGLDMLHIQADKSWEIWNSDFQA